MNNKNFFPRNISQSIILLMFFILVAGAFTFLLAKTIGDDKLLMHIYFSTGSVIIITFSNWKNRSSKERLNYDWRIVRTPFLITLLLVLVIFHFGIVFPVVKALNIAENPDSMFTLDNLIGFVIFAPIYEEIIFRNIVLRGLLTKYSGQSSIAISTVLFALVHIDVANLYWGKVIVALFFGLFSGWLFYKTRRIGLCIIVHSFSNLMAITSFSLRNYMPTSFQHSFSSIGLFLLTLTLAILIILYLLIYINKKIKVLEFKKDSKMIEETD